MLIELTEKQAAVIRDACELYGRVQIGQFDLLSEIITQTGWQGSMLRTEKEKPKGITDKEWKAALKREEEKDRQIAQCLEGAIEGIWKNAYAYAQDRRANEANIAMDIWAALSGRRNESDFVMGSEPKIKVYAKQSKNTDSSEEADATH